MDPAVSENPSGKSALKSVKLPSLRVKGGKLTKIWLRKVAKFYRRLLGVTVAELYFRSFLTHHSQTRQAY